MIKLHLKKLSALDAGNLDISSQNVQNIKRLSRRKRKTPEDTNKDPPPTNTKRRRRDLLLKTGVTLIQHLHLVLVKMKKKRAPMTA